MKNLLNIKKIDYTPVHISLITCTSLTNMTLLNGIIENPNVTHPKTDPFSRLIHWLPVATTESRVHKKKFIFRCVKHEKNTKAVFAACSWSLGGQHPCPSSISTIYTPGSHRNKKGHAFQATTSKSKEDVKNEGRSKEVDEKKAETAAEAMRGILWSCGR